MTATIASIEAVEANLFTLLEATVRNVKHIERAARRHLPQEFEEAFRATGGPYCSPQLQSPDPSSDDGEGSDSSAEGGGPAAAPEAASSATVSTGGACAAVVALMTATLAAQLEVANRLAGETTKYAAAMVTVQQACVALRPPLKECGAFVCRRGAARPPALSRPASARLCSWVRGATEVERRSRALLSWLRLSEVGSAALASPAGQTLPPAAATPTAGGSPVAAGGDTDDRVASFSSPTPATAVAPAVKAAGSTTGLAKDTADPDGVAGVVASAADAVVRNGRAARERRNTRAKKLANGVLQQAEEEMDADRLTLVAQSTTLRELMGVLGRMDYNIVSFQIRTLSQQLGECGPLLWSAALDICVRTEDSDSDDDGATLQQWLPDAVNADLPETTAGGAHRWVELAHAQPSTQKGDAAAAVVPMAAAMLFPRELAHYRSLGRPDATTPDDEAAWEAVRQIRSGREVCVGCATGFVLDRTSFASQAFRYMERAAPAVGAMTLDVHAEGRGAGGGPTPAACVVRICRGDGSVIVTLSSSDLHATTEGTPHDGDSGVPAPQPWAAMPLVPTLLSAISKAAEALDVLVGYDALKRSFDRLRLPVAAEPQEYVSSYLCLLFGMWRDTSGVLHDATETRDICEGGRRWTTVSVGIPRQPSVSTSERRHVPIGSFLSGRGDAGAKEAMRCIGKANFTAELLRTLSAGTTAQKVRAEGLLLAEAPAMLPLMDPLRQARLKLAAPPDMNARVRVCVGGQAAGCTRALPGSRVLSWCDALIAETIREELRHVEDVLQERVTAEFPHFACDLRWHTGVVDTFFAGLPRGQHTFARYISFTPGALADADYENDEGCGVISVDGAGPLTALCSATERVLAQLQRLPANVQSRLKGEPVKAADADAAVPHSTLTWHPTQVIPA